MNRTDKGWSPYRDTIREVAAKIGRVGYDPLQIEEWMRLEHGCLDGLDARTFDREVAIACDLIDRDPALSERLVAGYR